MEYAEITQDDLFDLGFEPLVTENTKTIDYEHKELGIHLWKGMYPTNPAQSYWKVGVGQEKVEFKSLEQLKEYMEQVSAGQSEE